MFQRAIFLSLSHLNVGTASCSHIFQAILGWVRGSLINALFLDLDLEYHLVPISRDILKYMLADIRGLVFGIFCRKSAGYE